MCNCVHEVDGTSFGLPFHYVLPFSVSNLVEWSVKKELSHWSLQEMDTDLVIVEFFLHIL